MHPLQFRWIPIFLAVASIAFAQAPAITAVVNSLSGDARLSPGLVAEVYDVPFSQSDLRQDGRNETVAVHIGGRTAGVRSIAAFAGTTMGIATVLLPQELARGPTSLTITASGGTSAPFGVSLDSYSPGLGLLWVNCEAKSQVAYARAVGLGPIVPVAGLAGPGAYTTRSQPSVTIAGRAAEVQGIWASSYGDYQVGFRIPPETPEGIWPVVLTIGGATSNTVSVLAGTENRLPTDVYSRGLPDLIQVAADSIVAAYSCAVPLADGSYTADAKNPPYNLGGTTVTVTDSAGVIRSAPILSASRSTVNYILPATTATGRASVVFALSSVVVSTAPLDVETVEPGLFCVGTCGWTPSVRGYIVRVRNGAETIESLESSIDMGLETDRVYLVMLATGLPNRSALTNVTVRIGNLELPVEYAAPQGEYAGMDQVNVRLPWRPAGQSGAAYGNSLRVIVDGKTAVEMAVSPIKEN